MKTDVLVIGAGLSGLNTACELQKSGLRVILLEARNRLGGRILSKHLPGSKFKPEQYAFELGPSWFWPGQLRIQALIEALGFKDDIFEQTQLGDSVYEDQNGRFSTGVHGISMQGSLRLSGGFIKLVKALARQIPEENCLIDACVTEIHQHKDVIRSIFIHRDKCGEIISDYVVVALPPRLAATSIRFTPALPASRLSELNSISTWMAGQAKMVLVYDKPFWHNQGMSGDVISQLGPLHEIHDASAVTGAPCALTGFVSVAPAERKGRKEDLHQSAVLQLQRIFGPAAASPSRIYMQDWAFTTYTATPEDQAVMMFHPANQLDSVTEKSWQGRLIWSGTETAGIEGGNNGYLEGALEASERTTRYLYSKLL